MFRSKEEWASCSGVANLQSFNWGPLWELECHTLWLYFYVRMNRDRQFSFVSQGVFHIWKTTSWNCLYLASLEIEKIFMFHLLSKHFFLNIQNEYLGNDEPVVFSAPLGLLYKKNQCYNLINSCPVIDYSKVFS